MTLALKAAASERASRMKALGIATARENAGMAQDIVDATIDRYIAGASFTEAWESVKDDLQQKALQRYGDKIRAALRRAGLDYPDDVALEPEKIQQIIAQQSGLDLQDLSVDGAVAAVDKLLADRLSKALGIEVGSVLHPENMKEIVAQAVRNALANGTAEKLLTAGMTRAARRYATWRGAGIVEVVEQQRLLHRVAQKKYARTHRQVWI